MAFSEKAKHIGAELKGHAPFTLFGAVAGLAFMVVFMRIGKPVASDLFEVFHPMHVLLSAMATASMFAIHRKAKNFLLILVIGYIGSIGIATLSDSVVPYIGTKILGLDVPTHADIHSEEVEEADGHEGHGHETPEEDGGSKLHIGFIEDWYIVNPAALLGIIIAYLLPRTKTPHAAHVLLSTWASSAHIMMNTQGDITIAAFGGIFVILFIAVWIPCCVSDIVFPLLFVKSDITLVQTCKCADHAIHSHPHEHEHSQECPEGEEHSEE